MTEQPTVTPPALARATRALRRRGPVIALLLVSVLCAGVVLSQVLQQPKPAPAPAVHAAPAPAPVKLDTVTVERGEIQQTVNASGKLQLFKYVDVSTQMAGQVKDVLVAVGDSVKAGAMVVEITPTVQPTKVESIRAQMARLQAELSDQRAQLDYAELQFKRQTQLKAQNATREDAFESSRMGVSSANARVDSILAQIRQVEANLKIDEESRQHAQVLAPISGTVVSLNAHPGQLVGAGQPGTPLLRIADQTKMTVQARVAEIDVTRLRRGMTATFTTPGYPGQQWSGKLRQIMPIPADGTGEQGKDTFYNVLFEVSNPDQQLMSGMSTQVRFLVAQAQDAVLLPVRALGTPDADGLYNANVVDAQRNISPRKLKIGLRNNQKVQVLSGLAVGDQVVVGKIPPGLPKQEPAQAAAPAGPSA
ncbi:MAG: efflux transporter periplasmic adaptor subunit [Massilia sp.]|nr:efflux transporter periplasmic adaptor subunit [Massilia sp.]